VQLVLSRWAGPTPPARQAANLVRCLVTAGSIALSASSGAQSLAWALTVPSVRPPDRVPAPRGAWKFLSEPNATLAYDLPSRETAAEVLALAVRVREEIAGELGERSREPIAIYLCKDAASFHDVAGSEPGGEQVGVAVPGKHTIVILAFRGGRPTDLSETIAHEVAHIVLADAAGGDLPRWFHEGFALYQSHQLTIAEAFHLALAGLAGRLIPLSEMEGRFPYNTRLSHLAYAQSLDAFSYLSSAIGLAGVGSLVRGVERHGSFSLAFRTVYGASFATFEDSWRTSVTRRYRWVLLTSGWVPLLFIIALVAGLLKLRAVRRTLSRWDIEEHGGRAAEGQWARGAEEQGS
jgi:hypothetical protein